MQCLWKEIYIQTAHEENNVVEENTRNMRERLQCYVCVFKTTSDYVLEQHNKLVHQVKVKACSSKRKLCNACGKRFNKEFNYITHMRTIHGGKVDQQQHEGNLI